MKYVLLFCGTREGQRAYDDMAPDELRAQLADRRALGLTANPAERALLEHRIG